MSTETLREVVRADGATVRLTRTRYGALSTQTWCIELVRPAGTEARVALFEADALRAFDRVVGGAL